ncbi:hypothetical protein SAMN05421505_111107 [Sinosporangium album]|uniref:Nucleotidyltransferase domain-containing protein n=1 Tax=Sinosporangium album TaxID=504805 RepID=A0A1G7ZLI0_9ACTN|nr:hypothetical protein [Sinosporangium album]SDH09519.1 hypothetical protein SAMN05421505_111107 [Sinosporangium album]
MKNTEIFERLSGTQHVVGLSLCGSHRLGVEDRYSDVDVWVFVEPETPLSDSYCLDNIIPTGLGIELLSEGRDDTLVPFSVYNTLTADGILNLKILSLQVLTEFVQAAPSFDRGYLDDLENYHTMHVMWEHEDFITLHQRVLRERIVEPFTPQLASEWVSRYASTYWRSAFQGYLRQDPHSWRLLTTDMIKYLVDLCHLAAGRLPAPRKWALADTYLTALPQHRTLRRCLDAAASCDVTDRRQVLGVYQELAAAEVDILTLDHREFWWRSVFHERMRNLAVPGPIADLAMTAPLPLRLQPVR